MTMVNQFSAVAKIEQPRNIFKEDWNWKGTINESYLYPVFWDEVVPGDTLKLNTTFFGRLSTPFVPVLDNIYMDYHLFYVPFRILWDNYKKFTGEKVNPSDNTQYIMPYMTSDSTNGFAIQSLYDYFGMPTAIPSMRIDSGLMYLRAYNMIWNEWYRCEYLQNSVTVNTADTGDLQTDFNLLKRGKRGDYFTTCLPSPQRGPSVSVPLGTSAPVIGNGMTLGLTDGTKLSGALHYTYFTDNVASYGSNVGTNVGAPSQSLTNGYTIGVTTDPDKSGLIADLSSVSSITVNALRNVVTLQQYYELLNRYGTRYREQNYALFGVTIPDYVAYIPEYLGGSTSMINISPIPQTSSSDNTSPQGNLAAYATIASTGNGFVRSFHEAGVVIGLVSIRADLNYQQGLDRRFSRSTYEDFMKPIFAHTGDQPVYNKELIALGTSRDNEVFGFQERYADYRTRMNVITGKFRSSDPQSLDIWHLAQYFDPQNPPTLSSDFIEENPPIDRIVSVQNEPHFLLDVHHDYTVIRELPLYGIPGLTRL